MSDSTKGSYRNLIAKLSDGMLTADEADQLREVLKKDKISQEIYLDHIFVHALLEDEFGTVASVEESFKDLKAVAAVSKFSNSHEGDARESGSRYRGFLSRASIPFTSWTLVGSAVSVALLGLIATTVIINFTGDEKSMPLLLADSSFETQASVPQSTESESWFGDHAVAVEDWSDIQPVDGKKMLRFVKSLYDPDHVCEVYQVIDLASYPNFSEDDVTITASAFFNAVHKDSSDEESKFSVAMFAMAEEPESFAEEWEQGKTPALAYAGQLEKADRDSSSWQQVESRIDLPEGARFLVVQLSVIDGAMNHVERTREHFVDSVAVNMVSAK